MLFSCENKNKKLKQELKSSRRRFFADIVQKIADIFEKVHAARIIDGEILFESDGLFEKPFFSSTDVKIVGKFLARIELKQNQFFI